MKSNIIKNRYIELFLILIFILTLSSCATAHKYDSNKPFVKITQATSTDLRQFGSNPSANPYIEPKSLFRGKIDEFFILKISLNLPKKSKISIEPRAIRPDGKDSGRFYTRDSFIEYWKFKDVYDEDANPYGNTKMVAIQRSCLPSFEYMQKAGNFEYYLPLVSPNPIARPTNVSIDVFIDDVAFCSYIYLIE